MGKDKKCPPEGAPEWVMTYGDMMSLLLCFFILLASLSELKKEDEFKAIVEQVKKSFGILGGGAQLPTNDPPELSLIQLLEKMYRDQMTKPKESFQDEPAQRGKRMKVRKVTPGKQFTVGGSITFEPGSVELTEYAKAMLLEIAGLLRGKNNKVNIKGHGAKGELLETGDYDDIDKLSFGRAKAVKDFLISHEGGVRPERIVLIAVGDSEPMVERKYSADETRENRRVEVVVDERTVADYQHSRVDVPEESF